ncbi:MAG: DUF1573 domain-containing protein [Bacteroidales bacterium]|nr:DUF1573 domain-containing protein [Bacteroidales bacterium]
MKKLFILILTVAMGVSLNAQQAKSKMQLLETEHDFGKFKEEAGRQTYDFIVTNIGTDPLVIQNISASCGCTTPEWTRSPIPAGGKGKITAIYDPKNRPGPFNKTLTVYSNSSPSMTVLTIKGEVMPREKTVEELFTFPVGGTVRFESNHLAFTNVKKTEKKIRVMQIVNTSDKDATVEFVNLPSHLTLKLNTATLKPGQKGMVEGTYDGSKNNGWGNVSDMVRMKVNGVAVENVYYYVSANLVEDFSSLTKAELDNAPVFNVESKTVSIGAMKPSTQKDVEFKFQNTGKSDLVIRHIRSTCGCTAIQQGSKGVIKPGEWSTIKATFSSGGYSGRTTKTIYVYTNDPKNSEVALMLNADVEQATAAR